MQGQPGGPSYARPGQGLPGQGVGQPLRPPHPGAQAQGGQQQQPNALSRSQPGGAGLQPPNMRMQQPQRPLSANAARPSPSPRPQSATAAATSSSSRPPMPQQGQHSYPSAQQQQQFLNPHQQQQRGPSPFQPNGNQRAVSPRPPTGAAPPGPQRSPMPHQQHPGQAAGPGGARPFSPAANARPQPGTNGPMPMSSPPVQGMQQLSVQPTGPERGNSVSPAPNASEPSPVRSKRPVRAYHVQESQPQSAPGPSSMPSQFAAQHHQPQQQQQHQQPQHEMHQPQQHYQQPHFDPSVSQDGRYPSRPGQHDPRLAPEDPRNAPPASYQDSQQQQQQQHHHASQGIPQPPHSAGHKIPGKMRIKIDPDHIPSPVAVQETDQQAFNYEAYYTCSRQPAPLSTTDYVAVDQGNCSPRFMRMTTYALPSAPDIASSSDLPLGIIVQPFAPTKPQEGSVQAVDFVEHGPPRCTRCRGYINPWCQFIEGGQKFVCNLCGHQTDVQPEYFSNLDMNQRRLDLDERPELRLGSIDFVVGRDYYVQDGPKNAPEPMPREPKPLNYVFAIDVSFSAGRCGLVGQVVKGLKEILYPGSAGSQDDPASGAATNGDAQEQTPLLQPGSKVAIVTFDKTVQFYNLKEGLEQPQMLVVSDLMDMFVPLSDGFFVDPQDSRPVIEALLDSLPALAENNQTVEAALGAPMQAAALAMKNMGGQVNIFQTVLPTIGPGALKSREDTKLYGTDKEKTLFVSQDPLYRQLGEECAEAGIGVNLFLFPSQYIDVASLGVLSALTGGETFFHPRFEPVRDGAKLRSEMRRVVERETAYSVTLRIRCSNGLRISDHFGNFFQRNITDLEFGIVDADKAIAARIKHEGKLDEKLDAHFQCAVLYTTASGQRRVRVHNIAVPVTSTLANVYRAADMDATITLLAKDGITQATSKTLRQVRESLTEACAKALLAYRKHCASSTSPAQLILPESFKLFPLYALATMKTKALKGGPVASDVRIWHMRLLKAASVLSTIRILYPRMMALHDLPPQAGAIDDRGKVILPPFVRVSYARMEPHGAYLIENGEISILWLGQAVSPKLLQDLYGVQSLQELDTRMTALPSLPTQLSSQVRTILGQFERERDRQPGSGSLPVLVARQNVDGTEIEFSNMLVEDANNEQFNYIDYLCFVHQQIQAELMGENKKVEYTDASSFTTW